MSEYEQRDFKANYSSVFFMFKVRMLVIKNLIKLYRDFLSSKDRKIDETLQDNNNNKKKTVNLGDITIKTTQK